ncbi:putative reductase domain protein [Nocardiopsis alba ATCC BAA-2165]|uniref:Putative reductase domain protein n=1 Tax=Nocardiopsis alba (strain ATCC BAA-2165 / BE74) TaxID=1205910 RepID=J7LCK9_NOCAA|nr:putative reductase domain protein [Nocardiopsis alba ATCC BAA-2165]
MPGRIRELGEGLAHPPVGDDRRIDHGVEPLAAQRSQSVLVVTIHSHQSGALGDGPGPTSRRADHLVSAGHRGGRHLSRQELSTAQYQPTTHFVTPNHVGSRREH